MCNKLPPPEPWEFEVEQSPRESRADWSPDDWREHERRIEAHAHRVTMEDAAKRIAAVTRQLRKRLAAPPPRPKGNTPVYCGGVSFDSAMNAARFVAGNSPTAKPVSTLAREIVRAARIGRRYLGLDWRLAEVPGEGACHA